MNPLSPITKVTGHVANAAQTGDLRYLQEPQSRGNWGVTPLPPQRRIIIIVVVVIRRGR